MPRSPPGLIKLMIALSDLIEKCCETSRAFSSSKVLNMELATAGISFLTKNHRHKNKHNYQKCRQSSAHCKLYDQQHHHYHRNKRV